VTEAARPKLVPVSEEMKIWAAALGTEMAAWPNVSTRPMFGFTAFYRGKGIFAILPRTRGMGSSSALAFKMENAGPRVKARLSKDARISTTVMQATRWFVFEVSSESDLRGALLWLSRAYEGAR
jgi:hypothetical protein